MSIGILDLYPVRRGAAESIGIMALYPVWRGAAEEGVHMNGKFSCQGIARTYFDIEEPCQCLIVKIFL